MLPLKNTLSKILQKRLLIKISSSKGRLTSFYVNHYLLTTGMCSFEIDSKIIAWFNIGNIIPFQILQFDHFYGKQTFHIICL